MSDNKYINLLLKEFIDKIKRDYNLKQEEIALKLGVTDRHLSGVINGKFPLSKKLSDTIYEEFHITVNHFPDRPEELISGSSPLIPFYDDVTSIGGVNDMVAESGPVKEPAEYINAGDWFREATAAIRHYGQSMDEYPSGCILAIREVKNRDLIVWGKDYVIETTEYRITKRLQKGKDDDHIKAYSTNKEKYPDGQLMHEPIDINRDLIKRLFLILGYVVKKNGGTMFFNNHKQQ
jgi:hypothetical protein